jgi:methylmalonyl-CoA/ethylmalonyl-CoA epimerase
MSHRIVRTFHSTCMVNDYDRTVTALGHVAGLRVLEYSEAPAIGRRGGMTWLGDGSIEVAEPIVPGHAAARFLERFGPGMHSYAFQVENLDDTIEHLARGGVDVGVRPEPGFCFTDPRRTGGLLFEWSDFTVPEDPRDGAPVPPHHGQPVLDVRTHAFIGALVPEPSAWADEFGELFGLVETSRNPGATPDQPVVSLAAPDCVLALFRLTPHTSEEFWGSAHTRARCHVLGLGVPSLDSAGRSLENAGVAIRRRTDEAIFVHPEETGEVPLMLVENLLAGDPRGALNGDAGTPPSG